MAENKSDTPKRKYLVWADGDEIKVMDLGKDWHTKISTQAMVRVDMSKVYSNDRKRLVQSVCDSFSEEFYGYDSENDYYAGFDDGLKRAMRLMKAEVCE